MSQDAAVPSDGQTMTSAPPAPAAGPAAPERDGADDWKSKARLWESRAKANAEAAERLQELENRTKTAEQLQAEKIAALEEQVRQFEVTKQVATWKAEAAAATGVPESLLRGEDQESILEHARAVKEHLDSITKPRPIPSEGQPRQQPAISDEKQFVNKLFN